MLQSDFEHFDSKLTEKGEELQAFGEMCKIYDTVQSCFGEARKMKDSLGDVHISAIGLDTLIDMYESLGKDLDNGRLTNFHNNRDISQARIEQTFEDIDSTIKKTEKLVDKPSPRMAKTMGFASVDDAKTSLSEELSTGEKKLIEQLTTLNNNPGIHHKSIHPQLIKNIGFIKTALKDLEFDKRQQDRQEHLAQKEAESLLKKIAPWKSASAGQKPMLGKKVSHPQPTVIRPHETLEKTDLSLMSDTVSLSPPVVR
ncbi:hypothetical protein [Pseudomonas sp. TH31]|uniref:hypothetical protein n=1 Tax=Pseudomonas sp. TH31 TaxID=2796396 RepID=UPI001911A0E0|nr:hypothetical protein [Pseudomonas sp. TH31]MBK5418396.1 hypothetical protein [Pseudomonas sp. TH31]